MTYEDKQLINIKQLISWVENESQSQVRKWGVQNCSIFEWNMFLIEEIGEFNQAIADFEYGRYENGAEQKEKIVCEGIQAVTLLMKMIEMYME